MEHIQPQLPPRAVGFWPSAFLLALLAAAKPVFFDTLDPDFFWHLLVANQLQAEGIHPLVDHLSFTSSPAPWTPYSWLSELLMKALWDAGGYHAILAAHAAMLAVFVLLFTAIARECVPSSASRAYAAGLVATGCCTILGMPWFSFRPAAMCMVLLALGMWLLQRDYRRAEGSRAVWLLIPVAAAAVRIHLFAFLLPIWVGFFLLASLCERTSRQHTRRYGLLLAGVLIACICTPMLPDVARTLTYYQFSDPAVASGLIVEMQPIYAGSFGKFLLLLLGLIGVLLMRGRRSVGLVNWFLLASGTVLLLQHGRYAPLFAISLASPLTMALTDVSDHWLRKKWLGTALIGGAAAGVCFFAYCFPSTRMDLDKWLRGRGLRYPVEACNFVANRVKPESGRLINDFTDGGYLAWRLHDEYQVFVDGRTQIRPPSFWRRAYFGSSQEIGSYLASADADAALLTPSSPFLQPLLDEHWRQVYVGSDGVVLIPPSRSGFTASDR